LAETALVPILGALGGDEYGVTHNAVNYRRDDRIPTGI
jgi:hypothetical protein